MSEAVEPALPPCPQCASSYAYADGALLVCPECGHEWVPGGSSDAADFGPLEVRDAVGNVLADGDSVTIIKDLKVKGAGQTLKQGTVIRSIRLTDNDEEIDCRYEGIKGLVLRVEFVRKH